jgi:hypothetical protein
VKSVSGHKLASIMLRAVDHVLAIHAYGPASAATALHALSTVSVLDETTVSPAAATVMAVHECKSNPVPASYVSCSTTDGHAMWKNDRPVCHAGPHVPAPAVDMLQRPGQERAADGHCAVVETSKYFHPYVQRFIPSLRDSARQSNMETIVHSLQRCGQSSLRRQGCLRRHSPRSCQLRACYARRQLLNVTYLQPT